jgi:hypothetical protein
MYVLDKDFQYMKYQLMKTKGKDKSKITNTISKFIPLQTGRIFEQNVRKEKIF